MKAKIALIALSMAAASPAYANELLRDLSDQTGLSERKVSMILGNRTSFAEYRYSYDRSVERFKTGVGEDNYRRLLGGEPVVTTEFPGRDVAIQGPTRGPESTL